MTPPCVETGCRIPNYWADLLTTPPATALGARVADGEFGERALGHTLAEHSRAITCRPGGTPWIQAKFVATLAEPGRAGRAEDVCDDQLSTTQLS